MKYFTVVFFVLVSILAISFLILIPISIINSTKKKEKLHSKEYKFVIAIINILSLGEFLQTEFYLHIIYSEFKHYFNKNVVNMIKILQNIAFGDKFKILFNQDDEQLQNLVIQKIKCAIKQNYESAPFRFAVDPILLKKIDFLLNTEQYKEARNCFNEWSSYANSLIKNKKWSKLTIILITVLNCIVSFINEARFIKLKYEFLFLLVVALIFNHIFESSNK